MDDRCAVHNYAVCLKDVFTVGFRCIRLELKPGTRPTAQFVAERAFGTAVQEGKVPAARH